VALSTYWTIPTQGDPSPQGRRGWTSRADHPANGHLTDPRPGRFTDADHLVQVARGAESVGFDGLLVPYDSQGEESWIVATALAHEVRRLRIVTEFQPGFATAVYTAKLSLSFQRYFADRLAWKPALTTGDAAQRAVGDAVAGDAVVARIDELLTITDGVWHESGFSHLGAFFEVEGGGLFDPTTNAGGFTRRIGRRPHPEVFLDGTSDAELELSARHADVHLFDLDDPSAVATAVSRHRQLAAEHERTVRYGVRTAVLARETFDEAWTATRRAWAAAPGTGDDAEFGSLRTERAVWRGFDRLGLPVRAGLVGSFADVAARLRALHDVGVSVLVLDAVDHLAEVYRIGEFLLPLLDRQPAVTA
jgi:alkanesulfonate monooxygenase